ncbi:MAG: HEAT repeat domain-containing protein [Planctomycetota bacterium]
MSRKLWLFSVVISLGLFFVFALDQAANGTSNDEWKELEKSFKKEYSSTDGQKSGAHRAAAVQKLTGADHPGLVKLMVNTVIPNELKNNDPVVVDLAEAALGKLQNQEAIGELINESKKGSKEIRVILINALGKVNNDDTIKQLIDFVNDSDLNIICAALDALARTRSDKAVEAAIKHLDNSKLPVVLSAIRYLGSLSDESKKETILNALRDRKEKEKKDERLKRELADAITRVSQTKPSSDQEGKSETVAMFYGIPIHNPIFVVDISMSMTMPMTRIETLKKELKQAIDGLAKRDEVFDIITFGDKTNVWKGQMVPAKQYKDEAFKWIDNLRPEGFTNIYDALELALQGGTAGGKFTLIFTGSEKSKQEEICLLTDGAPNRGKYIHPEDIINAVGVLNKTRKLKIHCIGISIENRRTDVAGGGMGGDHSAGGATPPPPDNRPGMLVSEFLKQLAEKNNGVYIEK